MRILMLSNLWPPSVLGGAELYGSQLAERLEERGHEVRAVTVGIEGPDVEATVRSWPYPLQDWAAQPMWKRQLFQVQDAYNLAGGRTVAKAIRSFRPDVVHSHAVQGMSATALAAPNRQGVAHVHTLHDLWLLCRRNTLVKADGTACERRCLPCAAISGVRAAVLRRHFADVVIAPSQAVADEHLAFGLAPERMRVVHHPAEAAMPSRRRRVPDCTGPVTFGFIGQLNPNKGVLTLLRAVESLGPAIAQVVVAGKGQLADDVEAAARRSGGSVDYLGWVAGADKDAFFDRIDCLVVPSEWREPAGLVNIEARVRAVPVIGSRIGGIPEYIPPACRPLLFESGNQLALEDSMRRYVADPARYAPDPDDLGVLWPEHLDQLEGLYAEARHLVARPT